MRNTSDLQFTRPSFMYALGYTQARAEETHKRKVKNFFPQSQSVWNFRRMMWICWPQHSFWSHHTVNKADLTVLDVVLQSLFPDVYVEMCIFLNLPFSKLGCIKSKLETKMTQRRLVSLCKMITDLRERWTSVTLWMILLKWKGKNNFI